MDETNCIKHHDEIKKAMRTIALDELMLYKAEDNSNIYYSRIVSCQNCGQEIKILIQLKTDFLIDGYLS